MIKREVAFKLGDLVPQEILDFSKNLPKADNFKPEIKVNKPNLQVNDHGKVKKCLSCNQVIPG